MALVPFKMSLPMNWDILGRFSPTSFPNEINILKLEQLNHQMTICIYKGALLDKRREVEHFRLFSVFLAAGLVGMSSESLSFSNASNTGKRNFILRWLLDLGNTSLEQNL